MARKQGLTEAIRPEAQLCVIASTLSGRRVTVRIHKASTPAKVKLGSLKSILFIQKQKSFSQEVLSLDNLRWEVIICLIKCLFPSIIAESVNSGKLLSKL